MQQSDRIQPESSNTKISFSHATTMNEIEVQFLLSKLKQSRNYLEFGSGFSTIEACRHVKETVISIETSGPYLFAMSEYLNELGIQHSNVF